MGGTEDRAWTTELSLSSPFFTWALRMLVVQSHISSSSVQDRYLGVIRGEFRRREKVTAIGTEDRKSKEIEGKGQS